MKAIILNEGVTCSLSTSGKSEVDSRGYHASSFNTHYPFPISRHLLISQGKHTVTAQHHKEGQFQGQTKGWPKHVSPLSCPQIGKSHQGTDRRP